MFPTLQAIVDADVARHAGWPPADLARAFLDGGARFLQLRGKQLSSAAFLEWADSVMAVAHDYQALVIVNDRVDVAKLSGANGVHVGQDDVPPADARRLLGPDAIVGYSTHSVVQIESAARAALSYIAVGPVFGTATKDTGYQAVGVDLVSVASRVAAPIPIVAIGGVTLGNAHAAIDAGASCVAVISDLLTGGDPVARVKAFVRSLA